MDTSRRAFLFGVAAIAVTGVVLPTVAGASPDPVPNRSPDGFPDFDAPTPYRKAGAPAEFESITISGSLDGIQLRPGDTILLSNGDFEGVYEVKEIDRTIGLGKAEVRLRGQNRIGGALDEVAWFADAKHEKEAARTRLPRESTSERARALQADPTRSRYTWPSPKRSRRR